MNKNNNSFFTSEQKGNHDDTAHNYDISVMSDYVTGDLIREKYFDVLKEAIVMSDLSEELEVLDIGIGTGLLTEMIPVDLKMYGIDISIKMMDKLKEKKLNAYLKLGSFLSIPFENACFNRIISTFAFHHVPFDKKNDAFCEMDRILKRGGYIVIGDLMFKNKADEKELRARFERLGKTDILFEFDDEFFTDILESSQFLIGLGYKCEYKQVSTLSWVLKAIKSI